jgi:hypothetical protein
VSDNGLALEKGKSDARQVRGDIQVATENVNLMFLDGYLSIFDVSA